MELSCFKGKVNASIGDIFRFGGGRWQITAFSEGDDPSVACKALDAVDEHQDNPDVVFSGGNVAVSLLSHEYSVYEDSSTPK